jgi:hypothetical protein
MCGGLAVAAVASSVMVSAWFRRNTDRINFAEPFFANAL